MHNRCAARYKVSAAQVAQGNKVGKSARFKGGQAIVVYTALKPVTTAAATRPTASKGKATARASKPAPATRKVAKDRGGKGRSNVASAAP